MEPLPKQDDLADAQLITQFAHRPHLFLKGFISSNESTKPSTINRDSLALLGSFEKLPREMVDEILRNMDFRSLSRFSQTSSLANRIVQELPAYRDMMKYASSTLVALSRTKLITHHSASTLHTALRSKECVSCKEYGSYVFLPTFERCCFECIQRNPAFWIIPLSKAEICFKLSRADIKRLPVMLSLKGTFGSYSKPPSQRDRRYKYVSVKAAKQLALAIHGSEEGYQGVLDKITELNALEFEILQSAPLGPSDFDPILDSSTHLITVCGYLRMSDHRFYCGMAAAMHFPSVHRDKTVDMGLWCRGCDDISQTCRELGLTPDVIASLGSKRRIRRAVCVEQLRRRAYSRDGFVKHARKCYGVKRLQTSRRPAM